jgi:sulfoxide reductase heme-binding subunit YedZ
VGYDYQKVTAALPFFLLFLTVVMGPVQVIWPRLRRRYKSTTLNAWRSEVGIWLVIWALIHVVLVVDVRGIDVLWVRPWAIGATISVALAVVLLFTSNKRVYRYLGPKAWKWHQSHATYLIFYMLAPHIWHRAYLIPGYPSTEPLHWMYLSMFAIVVILHVSELIKVVRHYRRTGKYPQGIR